eukprot:Pgem_evm1s2166
MFINSEAELCQVECTFKGKDFVKFVSFNYMITKEQALQIGNELINMRYINFLGD